MRGEVFAASAKDGGDAERVTTTPAREFGVAWAPDSRRLVYVSERDGDEQPLALRLHDADRNHARPAGAGRFGAPVVSPDGKSIAYRARPQRAARRSTIESKQTRVVATGEFARRLRSRRPIAWSPEQQVDRVSVSGVARLRNVNVVAAAAAKPGAEQAVSFLANSNTDSLAWRPTAPS